MIKPLRERVRILQQNNIDCDANLLGSKTALPPDLARIRRSDDYLNQDHLPEAVEGGAWTQVVPMDERHLCNTSITYGRSSVRRFILLLQSDMM